MITLVQPEGFPKPPSDWEVTGVKDGARFRLTFERKVPRFDGRTLVIVHGVGEHSGRYAHFPHYLASSVDRVIGFDHLGHGRSEGLRGHIESFDEYVQGVQQEVLRAAALAQAGSVHLFGHSLGGLISACTIAAGGEAVAALSSATLSAPFFDFGTEPPLYKRLAGRVLNVLWSSVQIPTDLDPSHLSREPAVAKAYAEDRLVFGKVTPRWFVESERARLALVSDVKAKTIKWTLPTQFLVPLSDQIVSPRAVQAFAEALECKDKRTLTYEGFQHESFNDVGREQVFEDIGEWIQKHS